MRPSAIVMINLQNYAQARFNYRKAAHLNQDDCQLYYKIACTYMNEGHMGKCNKKSSNSHANSSHATGI